MICEDVRERNLDKKEQEQNLLGRRDKVKEVQSPRLFLYCFD